MNNNIHFLLYNVDDFYFLLSYYSGSNFKYCVAEVMRVLVIFLILMNVFTLHLLSVYFIWCLFVLNLISSITDLLRDCIRNGYWITYFVPIKRKHGFSILLVTLLHPLPMSKNSCNWRTIPRWSGLIITLRERRLCLGIVLSDQGCWPYFSSLIIFLLN